MERPIAPISYLTYALAAGSLLTGAYMIDTAGKPEPSDQNAYSLDLNTSFKPDHKANSLPENKDNQK